MSVKRTNNTATRKKLEQYSYSLNEILGKGYSSNVFRGRNDETNKQVAIKVIDMRMIKGEVHKNLLISEIEILKILKNSPYIIEMFEIYNSKNNTYIITELCQGGDLSKIIINNKKLLQNEAINIILQIIKGYKQIYLKGIIHRDLKPANIFMKNNCIKIADFGFAMKNLENKKCSSYNVGSPIYMPPQALSQNKYSAKSDIWAIGVIFYQLLTGKTPWKAKTQKQLIKQLLTIPIKRLMPKNLSTCVVKFLLKTLTIDIVDRMSAEELINFNLVSQDRNNINCQDILNSKNNTIKGAYESQKIIMRAQCESTLNNNTKYNKKYLNKNSFGGQYKNISLPKTQATINKTEKIISPLNNNNKNNNNNNNNNSDNNSNNNNNNNSNDNKEQYLTKKTNFTQKNFHHLASISTKYLKYESIKNITQKQQLNKKQKQILSKQLLSQLHLCRFLYKLILRIENKLNAFINKKLQLLKSTLCSLIFIKLEQIIYLCNKNIIQQSNNQNQNQNYKQLIKIIQIVNQYNIKYTKQLQHIKQEKLNYQEIKLLLNEQILYFYQEFILIEKIEIIKQEIIVLDYLITLRQLISLLIKNNFEDFHNKSKIQAIVEGIPTNSITQMHIIAIKNKLKIIKIIN